LPDSNVTLIVAKVHRMKARELVSSRGDRPARKHPIKKHFANRLPMTRLRFAKVVMNQGNFAILSRIGRAYNAPKFAGQMPNRATSIVD